MSSISSHSFFPSGVIALMLSVTQVAQAEVTAPAPNEIPSINVEGAECSLVGTAFKIASDIRGLKIKDSVPCRLQNKAEVEKYLRDTIELKIPAAKLKNEERAYKIIGFIPQEFDYKNGLIKLYTEQLGGYYEPEGNFYAMASWMPGMMQMPIAVHELTHALQDQHFDLNALMGDQTQESDLMLARSAVVEGDATAVMLDYARQLSGQPSIAKEKSISGFMVQNIAGAMLSNALHSAPPTLQALLIFPYVSGLNFVHSTLKTDGFSGVNKIFKRLPESTEEILHPDKYQKGARDFREIPLEPGPEGYDRQGESSTYSDRIGEFMIAALLGSYLSPVEGSKAAAGWAGDRIQLFEPVGDAPGTVIWNTEWDTKADADEFFQALTSAYEKRFAVKATGTDNIRDFADKTIGELRVQQTGNKVRVVSGHRR